MATGLKNALEILPSVQNLVEFAVNEECAGDGSCSSYEGFGKPVYHIEYPSTTSVSQSARQQYCLQGEQLGSQITTVIKLLDLKGWVMYCDGSSATSPTTADGVTKGEHQCKTDSP
jgi:hypothetical protein